MSRRDARLNALSRRLSDRDRRLLQQVVRLRFLTAGQLERLAFDGIPEPVTRARRARRQLARLVELGLLWRLQRRVGGVRAGSTGYVYGPTAEARRVDAWLRHQPLSRAQAASEPGASFVEHSVACSELFVRLVEADRTGELELLEHQAEPACWRRFVGPANGLRNLRPDAFVSLGIGPWEQLAFVEIDRGTEGTAAIARKLETYIAYWRSGSEQHDRGVFPKVAWLAETSQREEQLRAQISSLPADVQGLFAVAGVDAALDVLCGPLLTPESRGAS